MMSLTPDMPFQTGDQGDPSGAARLVSARPSIWVTSAPAWASRAELESVLSSMPLRVWRHDTVTPLAAHPSDPGSGRVTGSQTSAAEADVLDGVLARWKAAVDAHQPEQVAALFTADAIFQGLHPYTVGPAGVADYYAAQPTGMTAAYTLRETRALSDGLVLGYLTVDFAFTDRATLTVQSRPYSAGHASAPRCRAPSRCRWRGSSRKAARERRMRARAGRCGRPPRSAR